MSSFFTLSASQKKRKQDGVASKSTPKKAKIDTKAARLHRMQREESISGSESDRDRGERGQDVKASESSSDSDEMEEETGAERRLRLAERYLKNIQGEVEEKSGFDAAEIDRDLIAERLKEDVAETKGRLYRYIADFFDFTRATTTSFRSHTASTTSIAVCPPYVYTTSADSSLIKWELSSCPIQPSAPSRKNGRSQGSRVQLPPPIRRRPTKLSTIKSSLKKSSQDSKTSLHHTGSILSVAASSDGQFVVTGGNDNRLIVWSAANLKPLKVFTQHRDSVTSLAFRRGTNQLYSASKDRTVKIWSLNELAYVETLFGHQDCIVDVAALSQERCLSAGARDRTARLWKVVDETQLIFLGGGGSGGTRKLHKINGPSVSTSNFAVGSLDRVAFIDEETFVTGSDNGSLMLWNVQKKKPIFLHLLAHGLQPSENIEDVSAEQHPKDVDNIPRTPQPRWITALATVPYSDVIVSGSWDGWVRAWKVSSDRRKIVALGPVGCLDASGCENGRVITNGERDEHSLTNGGQDEGKAGGLNGFRNEKQVPSEVKREHNNPCVRGIVNDLKVFERGEKGKESLCIIAAIGKEHRLGRWMRLNGRNDTIVMDIPRIQAGNRKKRKKNRRGEITNIKEEERSNTTE